MSGWNFKLCKDHLALGSLYRKPPSFTTLCPLTSNIHAVDICMIGSDCESVEENLEYLCPNSVNLWRLGISHGVPGFFCRVLEFPRSKFYGLEKRGDSEEHISNISEHSASDVHLGNRYYWEEAWIDIYLSLNLLLHSGASDCTFLSERRDH